MKPMWCMIHAYIQDFPRQLLWDSLRLGLAVRSDVSSLMHRFDRVHGLCANCSSVLPAPSVHAPIQSQKLHSRIDCSCETTYCSNFDSETLLKTFWIIWCYGDCKTFFVSFVPVEITFFLLVT